MLWPEMRGVDMGNNVWHVQSALGAGLLWGCA